MGLGGMISGGTAGRAKVTGGTDNIKLGSDVGTNFDSDDENNIAIGHDIMTVAGTAKKWNVGIGYESGKALTTGDQNIFIGYQAGEALTTGMRNVIMGRNAGLSTTDSSDIVVIGDEALKYATSISGGSVLIGHDSGKFMSGEITHVTVGIGGELGYGTHSSHGDNAGGDVMIGNRILSNINNNDVNITGAATTSGDKTVTCNSNADIQYGSPIAGTGIPDDAWVSVINAGTPGIGVTSFELNANATATNTGLTLTTNANNRAQKNGVYIGRYAGYGIGTKVSGVGENVYIGYEAGKSLGIGAKENVFIGEASGKSLAYDGKYCVGVGSFSGGANTYYGDKITTVGYAAGIAAGFSGPGNGDHGLSAFGYKAGYAINSAKYCTLLGYEAQGASTIGDWTTGIGAYGMLTYKTVKVDLTAADAGDNSIITELCKIPARAIIKSISAQVVTLSNLGTYKVNLSLSTSTGTAADIDLGSGATLKTNYYNEPTTTIVGTANTYLYACNAGTGNGSTTASTAGELYVTVAYIGQP